MNVKEAKKIIGYMLEWQFVLMGVKERSEIEVDEDFNKYSLQELLNASKIVESNNRRSENMQKHHREKGRKTHGRHVSMTIADRAIAAIYTALHFEPNGEGVVLINDVLVGCVKAEY